MKNNLLNKWWILVIISVLCIASQNGFAQNFGNNFRFDIVSNDFRFMITQDAKKAVSDTGIYSAQRFLEHYDRSSKMRISGVKSRTIIWDSLYKVKSDTNYNAKLDYFPNHNKPRSPIFLGVKLNPKLKNFYTADVNSISKSYACYMINDSTDAILIGLGITTENVSDYRYHVVENDSIEIIPWSPIPKLEQNYGASRPYAFFGKFNAVGKQLLIEVVNTKNYSIRDGVIFDWRTNFRPVVNQIIVSTPNGYFNLNYRKLNRDYTTKFDSVSGLPLDLKFPVDSIDYLRLNFESNPTIPYVVYLKQDIEGKIEINQIDYYLLKDYFDFSNDHFKTPGKYELIIQRAQSLNYFGEENILRIPFEVLAPPPMEKSFTASQIFPFALGFLIITITSFLIYSLYNKRKLIKSNRLKEKTELRLKSIRSQLNPHFMFNALNSIQNLMNKNDAENANHYLAIFSSLTRRVLNTGDQELISIEDEIHLLDDYLQMEQLRFGFKYTIDTDNILNKANIEIPAMLLQPLVENAVKHGVSTLGGKGSVVVEFKNTDKTLILSVADNGKGFDKNSIGLENKGLGLKLSSERITLLNKIYSKQLISMEFNPENSESTVTVTLKDWL